MLTKVRLVLLALLLMGSYAATPQAVVAVDVSPTAVQYEFTQNYTTDLVPGSGSGLPDSFNPTTIGNALYFQSNRGLVRAHESGTSEIRTSTDERLYYATNFVWFQNKVYFTANDAVWSTDGNTATLTADLWPGESESSPDRLTVAGDWLYFRAASPGTWVQLWRTNGDVVEQVSSTCIDGFVCDHDPDNLTPLGEKVLFRASDGDGYGIWSYDGVATSQIWDGPNSMWGTPTRLGVLGSKAYFATLSAGSGFTLNDGKLKIWQTDGTQSGTTVLTEISIDVTEYGTCSNFVLHLGALYLCVVSEQFDAELWSINVSTGAANLVSDINVTEGSWPDELMVVDNKLYFTADSDYSTSGRCLYELSLVGLSCITSATPQMYAHTLSARPDGISFVSGGKLWMHTEGTLRQVTPNSLSLNSLKWLSDSIVAASVWSGARGRELLVGTVSTRIEQSITFASIPNRTTGQPLTFAVPPTASSGLPVTLSASGACEVTGLLVSVLDKGTCTLTAAQDGDETWLPALAVTQSFTISRVLLSNKTITFRDASGAPVAGLKVSWRTPDGVYKSAGTVTSNSTGKVTFGKIAGGPVTFTLGGKVGSWDNGVGAYQSVPTVTSIVGPATTSVVVGPNSTDSPRTVRVKVVFEDGTPVPGAAVQVRGAWPIDGRYTEACLNATYEWYLRTCDVSGSTGVDGIAKLVLPGSRITTQIYARFSDVDLVQTSGYVAVGEDGTPQIVLENLPVVVLETEAVTLNYGVAQTVTAVARDSDGSPIVGRALTLSASTSGASASCSGRKTTATTNSAGRATFKVCPVKTATWSVDGRSIVGSAGVRLTVQLTPTAPRTLTATPKTRSVSLAWVVPVKANAGSVTDYIVQYRLQGATTWITFRDGTSTARKATVTGLTTGQAYEFRIAAKNKSGTGTWSDVVLGTPN